MRPIRSSLQLLTIASVLGALVPAAAQQNWNAVGAALGKQGKVYPDGVYKVSLPRYDLSQLSRDGIHLQPTFLRGTWISFEPRGSGTAVVADLALTEGEVTPVMDKLEGSGFQITGLHNHLTSVTPEVLFLHAMGDGDPLQLARALHAALLLSKTPFTEPAETAHPIDVNKAELDRTMGASSKIEDGVLQYRIGRRDTITENGMPILQTAGAEFGINLQPTGGGRAVITGDLPLIESEVQPVLHVLHSCHFEVTALHNHMLSEQPRLFFLHFWANGMASALVTGTRTALDQTQAKLK